MSDTYQMQPGGVGPGSYPLAVFLGAEDFQNQFGVAVRLRWKIVGGQYDGQEATRICSPRLTPGGALGKLATQIKGGPIQIGESFSFSQYVGTRGSLVVEATQGGGGRVSMFLREQSAQAAPAAAPPPPPAAAAQPTGFQAPTPEQMAAFAQWQAQQQQQKADEEFI